MALDISATNSSTAPRARSRDSVGSATMPNGTPITDSGMEKTVKANVNAVTEPAARPDAKAVATTKVIWPAPSATVRGPISRRAWRTSGSPASRFGVNRNPARANGGSWTSRCPSEPTTTPIASPVTPRLWVRMSAAPMIARL